MALHKISLSILVLYNFLNSTPNAILQPTIVAFLGGNCTSETDTSTQCSGPRFQAGIVLGSFYFTSFVTGVPFGFLANRLNSDRVFLLGLLVHIPTSLLIAVSSEYLTLTSAGLLYGVGLLLCTTTSSTIIASEFGNDSKRSRLINLGHLMGTASYAISFFFGTWVHQTFGHFVTFTVLTIEYGIFFVVYALSARERLKTGWRAVKINDESGYEILGSDNRTTEIDEDVNDTEISTGNPPPPNRGQCHILSVLAFGQLLLVYTGVSIAASTAPTWLQTKLDITVLQNGAILAASSTADFLVLLILTLYIHADTRRWVTIMCFILFQASGFLLYSFVTHSYQAILTEMGIRSAKAVTMSLGQSLVLRIVDVYGGSYTKTSALYVVFKHGGQILGALSGASLVHRLGFRTVYLSYGAMLAVLAVATPFYHKISRDASMRQVGSKILVES